MTKQIKTEFKITVSEAEATLASLEQKLIASNEHVAKLKDDCKVIAFDALTQGGTYKTKLDAFQAEIAAAAGLQEMTAVAIVQAKANLARAQAIEADRAAKALANEAREISKTQPIIADKLDKALTEFIATYHELYGVITELERRGYGVGTRHAYHYLTHYLTHTLSRADVDFKEIPGSGLPDKGNFKSIMTMFAGFVHNKTGAVIGDVLPEPIEVKPAPVIEQPAADKPIDPWAEHNARVDARNAAGRAPRVHTIVNN